MTRSDRFEVGLVQLNSALGDSSANLERAIPYIAKAAGQGADLVMFQSSTFRATGPTS
ncbi:MAG: hypothetical protein OXK73_14120 [Rhodospirillaceae bacterium]|nr:hypothetical protein [Rhodospirillaceae bacterium]